MKIKNYFIIPFIVCITMIYADSNIYNQIENDHRIRNFAFIGPFPKDYNADSLIKLAKSAPEKPGVPLAITKASTSLERGTFFI